MKTPEYNYLPPATAIAAEEIEHTVLLTTLYKGLLKQVFKDGKDAAYAEMREQQKEIDDYESRNPRL